MKLVYLSVVIPVYNEAANLDALYQRLTTTLDGLNKTYEIIFTNDGSRDNSIDVLRGFHQQRPKQIRIVDFNGNFGQHMAIMAAFEHVRGEIVVTLDADLQNPPEEIPKLLAAIEAGHDYVGGNRKIRHDSIFRRYASKLNNYIRYKITRIKMEDQGSMLRAYRRRVVDLMVAVMKPRRLFPPLPIASRAILLKLKCNTALAAQGNQNTISIVCCV